MKDMYTSAKENAAAALAQKEIVDPNVTFRSLRVHPVAVKAFWFVSGVKRKLKRRFGK